MGMIIRGFKNAFRNGIRSFAVIIILAISIGMALVMLVAMKAVDAKITSVKASVGNVVTISPAGAQGFEGGGTPLTGTQLKDVSSIAHVSKVTETLEDRVSTTGSSTGSGFGGGTSGTTSLSSAINPGTLGQRFNGGGSGSSSNQTLPTNFSLPIEIIGTNDLSMTQALGNVSQFKITSGQAFDATSNNNEALIGSGLATKNNLSVGGTFTAYDTTIKVDGIFDTGTEFSNGMVVMPLSSVQRLSAQSDQISSATVQVDSVDQVTAVTTAIKNKLGSAADVTSSIDAANNSLAPLENVKNISMYSLIGALVAGAVIIFLIMVMIVRERRQEIGVLKAIGASNAMVVGQFMSESMILALLGSIIGALIGFALANPILKMLVNNASSSASTAVRGAGGGGFARAFRGATSGFQNSLQSLHGAVGTSLILYAVLAAVAIAILGSAIPAFIISKIRPAEVMRAE